MKPNLIGIINYAWEYKMAAIMYHAGHKLNTTCTYHLLQDKKIVDQASYPENYYGFLRHHNYR